MTVTMPDIVRPTRDVERKSGEVITFTHIDNFDMVGLDAQWLLIKANRVMNADDRKRVLDIVEYAYRTTIAGRLWRTRQRTGTDAVWVRFPVTTSPRSDVTGAILDFQREVVTMILEGTPMRRTTSVRGRRGTRLVEGFDDLSVSLWADSVTPIGG